jgi:hypothetical protein
LHLPVERGLEIDDQFIDLRARLVFDMRGGGKGLQLLTTGTDSVCSQDAVLTLL